MQVYRVYWVYKGKQAILENTGYTRVNKDIEGVQKYTGCRYREYTGHTRVYRIYRAYRVTRVYRLYRVYWVY